MKKTRTLLLKIILAIGLFFLAIFLFIVIFSYYRKKKDKKDLIEYTKICDSIKIITEQPEIGFSGFNEKELSVLKFEIKRGKNIVLDTIIKNKFTYTSSDKVFRKTNIPFSEFLKTDTIIVTIPSNLKFYISTFHHGASSHYGMFGPFGDYECGLNSDFNINGEITNCISKDISFTESERKNRIEIIGATEEKIDSISKKSKITKQMAEKIFEKNRINIHWLSQIFCGIHVEKTANYYVFAEEREDKNGKKDIIKINATNGNYKRYSNYPFK